MLIFESCAPVLIEQVFDVLGRFFHTIFLWKIVIIVVVLVFVLVVITVKFAIRNKHRLSGAFSMVREGSEGNEGFLGRKFSGETVPMGTIITTTSISNFIENNLHDYHFLHGDLFLLYLQGEVYPIFKKGDYHFLHRDRCPDRATKLMNRSPSSEGSCSQAAACCSGSQNALK